MSIYRKIIQTLNGIPKFEFTKVGNPKLVWQGEEERFMK